MNKKSLDRKAAKKIIEQSRSAGKSEQEIYNELKEQYFDKKGIIVLMANEPTPQQKLKYKTLNTLLLFLIFVTIIAKLFGAFYLLTQVGIGIALFFIAFAPLINIVFFIEVYKYNGYIYKICGLLSLVGVGQSLTNSLHKSEILITIILGGSIAAICFYLNSNMLPGYKPGDLKVDEKGEYILS